MLYIWLVFGVLSIYNFDSELEYLLTSIAKKIWPVYLTKCTDAFWKYIWGLVKPFVKIWDLEFRIGETIWIVLYMKIKMIKSWFLYKKGFQLIALWTLAQDMTRDAINKIGDDLKVERTKTFVSRVAALVCLLCLTNRIRILSYFIYKPWKAHGQKIPFP